MVWEIKSVEIAYDRETDAKLRVFRATSENG